MVMDCFWCNSFNSSKSHSPPQNVICCHMQHLHFHFEVLFTKPRTCQVSIDGSKVSVVPLRGVSVLQGVKLQKNDRKMAGTNTRCPSLRGVHLIVVSVKRELTAYDFFCNLFYYLLFYF